MGVEWSSERMTRSPFGSVVIWYCSFGGRTAACTGVSATAAIATVSRNTAARSEGRICDRLWHRLPARNPEAGREPVDGGKLQLVGVDPPFGGQEQLHGGAASFEPHTSLAAEPELRAAASRAVDAEHTQAAHRHGRDAWTDADSSVRIRVQLPSIVDERSFDDTSDVCASLKLDSSARRAPANTAADHVPVHREALRTIAEVA